MRCFYLTTEQLVWRSALAGALVELIMLFSEELQIFDLSGSGGADLGSANEASMRRTGQRVWAVSALFQGPWFGLVSGKVPYGNAEWRIHYGLPLFAVDGGIAYWLASNAFDLVVIGAGSLEAALRPQTDRALLGRAQWLGCLPSRVIQDVILQGECLALPRRHDGWDAVVSESLMVCTTVICSDTRGSATAVRASGIGEVFPADNFTALTAHLSQALRARIADQYGREQVATWAARLDVKAGSGYLLQTISQREVASSRANVPWQRQESQGKGGGPNPTVDAQQTRFMQASE